MTGAPPDPGARQRAVAEARATFVRGRRGAEPMRLYETGGLRWRFPRATDVCEAALVNTGGGVAGGDSYRVALALGAGAAVEATTVAAEKIYRSDGPPARIATALELGDGARLRWLPQETLVFEGARLERSLAIDMAADADLLAVETLVFGRLAAGETRIDASLSDSWRLRRAGRLVFADETRLDRAGATLDRPACGAGARAIATLLAAAPGVEARLPDVRAALEGHEAEVEAGASAFDGLIVARLVSASPSRLRKAAIAAIVALSGREPPRLWQ
ncbi:urease accessory protein [Roseiarcus fermentans]|uniref:Urease accessory protein UreD n=1 Tax=Roseiarcus fermentans TaxID=1473586 RepID=A0A366FGQ3_9HYPH|nr:urease accessory protein UreD [Roseiarcus fermentans]RBP13853.1 urease accessory protein [Roseiarcus fermentans]